MPAESQLPHRVLFTSHDGELGGGQLALVDTVTALTRSAVDVHVLLPSLEGPLVPLLDAAGVTIHEGRVGLWASPPGTGEHSRGRATARLAKAAWFTGRLLKQVAPDLVITNTGLPGATALSAKRARIPHAWWLHERQERDDPLRYYLPLRVVRRAMRSTGSFIVPSVFLLEEVSRWAGVRQTSVVRPFVAVPSRLDDSALDLAARAPLNRVLFPGGLLAVKRPEDAVDAMAVTRERLTDLRLEITGHDGSARAEVERRLDLHHLRAAVRVRGFVAPLTAELSAGAVLLSCGKEETFGRVLVEAMAAGVPVVAAAGGATPEVLTHEVTGLLYPPGDSVALAQCLIRLAEDPDLRASLVRNAHEAAHRDWSAEAHIIDVTRVWGQIRPDAASSVQAHR